MSGGPTTTAKTKEIGSTTGSTDSSLGGTTSPWGPTQDILKSILSNASDISQVTPSPTQFMPQLGSLANLLFSGGGLGAGTGDLTKAFGTFSNALTPIAQGKFIGQDNPYLKGLLSTLETGARNTVGGAFSAAGRSFSGAHAGALGKAVTDAEAAPLFQNYWNERNAQTNAANSLLGGAQGYSGALDSSALNKLNTMLQAPGVVGQMGSLPFSGISSLLNLVLPIAGLGSQTTGFNRGTTRGTSNNFGTTIQQQQSDPFQTALGGGLGLLGLLSMGSTGGLGGLLGSKIGSLF